MMKPPVNPADTQSELSLLAKILGVNSAEIQEVQPLDGGCVASVSLIRFKKPVNFDASSAGGALSEVVLKRQTLQTLQTGQSQEPPQNIEALALEFLAKETMLPVPRVLSAATAYLVMTVLPGDSVMTPGRQQDAARHIAALHSVQPKADHKDSYGFAYDTCLGGLPQPNPWTDSWRNFYREHRIWYTAQQAHREGLLSVKVMRRLDKFCSRLDRWLDEPDSGPSLVHGDLWTTNILGVGDTITGFIDPAIYYGHPAMDLAFGTLFNTLQEPFFKTYSDYRPLPEGFFELVKDLYNLYPLLVHVRLFGAGYVSDIERILKRIGC